jgi:signal transduction histidine kinase
MAEEKRLDLLFLTPSHDIRVGDAMAVRRVLLNLTTNALKFTDSGHVEIVVNERGPSRLEFSVRDTGRGMDEKTVEALFQPFRRNRSRTGFDFSSTGLGLAMCRRLVELMGGELQVETRPGGGSRFSFELTLPRGSRV